MIIKFNNKSSINRVDLNESWPQHWMNWRSRDFRVVVENVCHEVVAPSLDGHVLYKIDDRYEIRKDIRVLERAPYLVVGAVQVS